MLSNNIHEIMVFVSKTHYSKHVTLKILKECSSTTYFESSCVPLVVYRPHFGMVALEAEGSKGHLPTGGGEKGIFA